MKKRIVTVIVAVLMLSTLLTAVASAEGETQIGETDLYWKYEANVLTITGTGALPDYESADSTPWALNNADITTVSLPDGLTGIGNNAFTGTGITAITIPDTVTALGSNVFPADIASITAPCRLSASLPTENVNVTFTHSPQEHAAVAATPTATGKSQYWECTSCHGLFADAACTSAVTDEALVTPKLDNEAPKHNTIIFGSTNVSQPYDSTSQTYVNITVYATDLPATAGSSSGISQGKITLKHSTNTLAPELSCNLNVNNNGTLTCSLPISFTTPSGTYYVSELFLADNAGNASTVAENTGTITITRGTRVNAVATLSLNATSVGYGGSVKGTIVFKDSYGNVLPNKTFEMYVGTQKTLSTATTDATGTATFNYTNTIPGTYYIKATFAGDTDYNACETNSVSVTFTNVPATGDSYNLALWIFVAAMSIGVNAWFFLSRKKA